ncbi:hypothetical protein [Streptomyces aureus]|uniref:hypothetical protein n=1 Tax=Streptomyces aureus TaxID=193461 RepID=UPI00056AC9C3|nr:hypothetical protein [Streptomyces aureus]
MPANATREQILAALQLGHSAARIARDLACDRGRVRRIRDEAGLPVYVRGSEQPSLTDRWRQHAVSTTNGHMEWTGERSTNSNRPLISFQYSHRSAAAVAFFLRTGRDPIGNAVADCGMRHCVAPEHVLDADERRRTREQLRYLQGRQPLRETCQAGHRQAEHARIDAAGTAYCHTCKSTRQSQARADRGAA